MANALRNGYACGVSDVPDSQVKRGQGGKFLAGGKPPAGVGRPVAWPRDWRARVREAYGDKLWLGLIELAEGKPWVPKLPDGREGPVQIPTSDVRLRAYLELADRLYGRTVPETEIARAAQAQNEYESLSDGELDAKLRGLFLERVKPQSLPAGQTTPKSPEPSKDGK